MITGIIIAKNAQEMVEDALKSLDWVDEIILIDNGSVDKTREIAKKYKAKVITYTSGKNFSDWRNKGLRKAKDNWVLYLDSDERVTPLLKKEILGEIQNPSFNAYAIPRRNFIFNHEFKHSGQYPDYQKRLFLRKNLKGWIGDLHEEPQFEGKLGHLKSPMIHLKDITLSQMMDKTNWWSEYEAKMMWEAKHPQMNVARFLSVILREFWLRMIKQLAFLDGPKGIIYAMYQVYSKFVSYAKLWEMQQK